MVDYTKLSDAELTAMYRAEQAAPPSYDDMSDDELIAAYQQEQAQPNKQQPFAPIEDVSTPEMIGRKARAGLAGAADMAMFGMADEAKAGFQGLIHGVGDNLYRGEGVPNLTIGEARQMYLDKARAEADQLREESPVMYHGGQLAAGVAIPAAAPKAITKGVANFAAKGLPQKYIAGAGLGAGAGSVYGAGSADEGERGQGALVGGGIGALGGAGGVAVTDIAKAAAKPITSRISAAIARKKAAKEMLAGNTPLINRANVPTDMNMQSGRMLDLTEGQLGQDAQRQSLEIGALKGGYGKEAQDLALSARATQQEQMRGALGELGADTIDAGQDALEASAKVLKGSYKDIKAQVNKAYDDARIIQGVYINQAPIDEVFKPQVNAILRGRGFPIEDFSERTGRIIKQLQDSGFYEGKKVTKTNLEKMEFWRRRATNAMNDANAPTSQIKEEGAALGQIISAYDDFMAKMPQHALMSGDEEALEAIGTARGTRRRMGVLFERNKVVKEIVQNNDLTNEELANMLITGSKQGEVVNKGAGRVIKGVKRGIPPEKQAEFTQNLKRGTMSRVLEKSLGTTRDGDFLEIMPNKLIKELKILDKNNTFMNELFDEPERVGIKALIKDLELINSVKQGADNYSNSAYTLMRWLDKAPFGGFGITSSASKLIAEPMAESGARKTLKQSLSPVIKQYADGLKGTSTYYGGATGGLATTGYNKEELQ